MLASCLRRSVSCALAPRVQSSNPVFVRFAGHNKWSKIAKSKAVADKKHGIVVTQIIFAVESAVKAGGPDPRLNLSLAKVMESGAKMKVDKSVMDRAIKRCVETPAVDLLVEGRSPLGFQLILVVPSRDPPASCYKHLTRSLKNTCVEITQGSALYAFNKKSLVVVPKVDGLPDLDDMAIECGAEDWRERTDLEGNPVIELICGDKEAHPVKLALDEMKVEYNGVEAAYLPKNEPVEIAEKDEEQVEELFEALDSHPNIRSYFTTVAGHS
ncbi:translational activator of cytochrome c oxidase 1-like [Sycon ciliatum]|uniref:translational activator of cytochrome c oxidase 1-like n=1 Tax=Sycon ciliatum TaxID=27933 RepID=UPI0031F6349F